MIIHLLLHSFFVNRVPEDQILFPRTDKNENYLSNLPNFDIATDRYCVCKYDDGKDHVKPIAESRCSYNRHQLCEHKKPKNLDCKLLKKPLRKRRDIPTHLKHVQKHLEFVRSVYKRSAERQTKVCRKFKNRVYVL